MAELGLVIAAQNKNHAVLMKTIIIYLRFLLQNSVWWRTGLKQNNCVQNPFTDISFT